MTPKPWKPLFTNYQSPYKPTNKIFHIEMKKFTLEILIHIIGLGSASGLIYNNDSLLLIGDNSAYLYDYSIPKIQLNKFAILKNPTENTDKKDKMDFEAITNSETDLYVFGSGSRNNRNKMIQINSKTKDTVSTIDLSHLYGDMQNFGQIEPTQFNIEGAIYDEGNFILFNRGNGKDNRSVIFTVSGNNLTNDYSILSNDYKLPKIKGFPTGFSDAILVDDKIYFLATAENSKSTTEDGRIVGTLIGRIDVKTLKIDFTNKFGPNQKFEGITLYAKSKDKVEFLLCEDNDTAVLESNIYKLTLEK